MWRGIKKGEEAFVFWITMKFLWLLFITQNTRVSWCRVDRCRRCCLFDNIWELTAQLSMQYQFSMSRSRFHWRHDMIHTAPNPYEMYFRWNTESSEQTFNAVIYFKCHQVNHRFSPLDHITHINTATKDWNRWKKIGNFSFKDWLHWGIRDCVCRCRLTIEEIVAVQQL